MTSTLNPYLSFRDNAREAMEFYQSVLGGDLNVMTFGDMGSDGPEKDLVMHGQLETPAGFTLMASDTPPGMEYAAPAGISVSLSGDDADDLRGWFDGLAEGGQITMPLEKQVWADYFGMLVDRFGISWLVNIAGDSAG
jgi:PhnB protein